MKKRNLFAMSLAAAIVIGCGENSSISDSNIKYDQSNIFAAQQVNVKYKDYTVNVADDAIVGAQVSAPECNSSEEYGDGIYVLKNCVSKPKYIMAVNGKIKDSNVTQNFPLVLNTSLVNNDDNFVVSPLTTLVADANESELESIAEKLGINKDDLFKDPTDDENLLNKTRKINAVMLAAVSSGTVANKVKFIDALREVIETNVNDGEINVTKIGEEVTKKAQENPALFGLVFINLKTNDENILQEIANKQNPKTVTFLGLVFDDKISDANITVKWADTNETFADNIISGSEGNFTIELNQTQLNDLNDSNNSNRILLFEAKARNGQVLLTSTMSVKDLLDSLGTTKLLTPSTNPNLIISNITTAETAILDKRDALKDTTSYDSNITDIKTYHQDKVLKAAAVIKDVVDNNNTDLLTSDKNNTYDLIAKNINNANDVNFSDNINNINTTELEKNITSNAILNSQLNYTPTDTQNIQKDKFENASKFAGNVFYRILAYCPTDSNCSDQNLIREYDKIVTLAGHYEITKCYIKGTNTKEWDCNETFTTDNANFNNGKYSITNGNYIDTYSLDNNDSISVDYTCKNYHIYDVSRKTYYLNEINNTTQMVLVDSYDIVDMYRRMPDMDSKTFNQLVDTVNENGHTREKVNFALNRFVRNSIEDVKKYFSDENSTNTCNNQ